MNQSIEILVPILADSEKEIRLDQYLSGILKGDPYNLSRSRLQKLIEDGFVLVDSRKAKVAQKLSGGEKIEISLPLPQELELKPQKMDLSIVYEDDDLLVIDKPAGLVVHPGAGVSEGTLVNALLAHCSGRLPGINGSLRPGIVHRLDKDTSGLMLVAKSDLAQQNLSAQIAARDVKRVYLALVEGQAPEKGEINKAIGRDLKDRKKMAVRPDGRNAVTGFEVELRWSKYCLVRAFLKTGRTHQIRVHMSSINCPVVGDLLYNKKSSGSLSARKKMGLAGQALHATYLAFSHPRSGQLLEFESKLPGDIQSLVDSL